MGALHSYGCNLTAVGLDRFLRRRGRRPADARSVSGTSDEEVAGRAADLSYSLGQARPDEQRVAAVERLTELRAAGQVSEENFLKEKRRLLGEG